MAKHYAGYDVFCEGMPPRRWDSNAPPIIRPLPHNLPAYVRRVRLCDRIGFCRRPNCTFPHNQQEMDQWNRQLQSRQETQAVPASGKGNLRLGPEWYCQPQRIVHQARLGPQHGGVPRHQTSQEMYAASKESFNERIKEELNIEVIQAPLTRDNYKKKFHHMICWEEKRHIEILEKKRSGVYKLVFYPTTLESSLRWIQSDNHVRYGKIEGIDPNKIAYAIQASEAVYIVVNPGEEVKADIMRANYNHTDENMYIGFTQDSIKQLTKVFPDLSSDTVIYDRVKIEFEVKHFFFDGLVRSVNYIDPIIIRRLLPRSQDFLMKSSDYFQYKHHMHAVISQLDPGDQFNALKTIVLCPAQSPPILINGSFGSGKTRVLAIAAYYITEMSKEPVRVLICAHHQMSADNIVESYFGDMMENKKFPWQIRLVRLTSSSHNARSKKFSKYYMKFHELCIEARSRRISTTTGNLVVATTCATALRLKDLFDPGFFTHILIDEGAQNREPEAIAPLALASSGTKIVIAGDSCQVGPALLVLGDETRDSGFKLSLLERLQMEYEKIGEPAKDYLLTLSTNYRCHKEILAIPSQLFYSDLQCKAQKADPHPKALYPLLFICSNLTADVCSPEVEARVLLDQVNFFVQHWRSDSSWGDYDLKKIAVVTSTYPQLVITRNIGKREYRDLYHIRLIPIYLIQGEEFPAVFLSTTEPIDEDGNTLNPTKSPCDRYVFNTVLTRAKSLVVVVGSPWVLLNTESHMVKLYGDKGKCWSLYLKSCLEHGTLIVPSQVQPDQNIARRFKEGLAAHLGATLPNNQIFPSSRANYRTRGTHLVAASNVYATNGSRLATPTQLSDIQHAAIQAKSGMRLVHKPLSSDKNVLKQMSQVEYTVPMNLQTTSSSYSQLAVQNKPAIPQMGSIQKLRVATVKPKSESPLSDKSAAKQTIQESRMDSTGAVSSSERTINTPPLQSIHRKNTANPKSENRVASQKSSSATKTPPQRKKISLNTSFDLTSAHISSLGACAVTPSPSNQTSASIPVNSRRAKKKTDVSSGHPMPSSTLLADFWPSPNEAAKTKTKKKIPQSKPSQQAVQSLKVPEVHSESFTHYKNELHIEYLKEPLTQKNYSQKFHHLLCWEEQEHDKILKQRCTGQYEVFVFQPKFEPYNMEYNGDEELIRYGYISSSDGDKLSYAKQASEGSFIILDDHTFIRAKHVYARVPKNTNSNAIVFGLTNDENFKLIRWSTLARKQCSYHLLVHFELKHSYFQRLHTALDNVNSDIIKKVMPNNENFIIKRWYLNEHEPEPDGLKLDSYQKRALRTIMSCAPGPPVLVTGPFGTGKTRLLARAAYEILKLGKTRVLICAHHQASVDTFVEILGNIIDKNEMIRIIPTKSYHSQTRNKYPHLFALRSHSQRLVITTLGILRFNYSRFSHILIDEGAQTREPEIIGPLRFALEWTRIIIAGDHLQVGPQLLVLGKEAQEYGLATSLLERLHNHYIELGEVAENHVASLLTNYRSQSGILMLPSSLFYGSTLQCRTREKPHPLATYPLHFVCTSLELVKSNSQSENPLEATTLLNQVQKFVQKWPEKQWGPKDLAKVCIMSPSPDQVALIRNMMYNKYKDLRGIELLKAYEIQGREFRAIFVGTSEITYMKDDASGHMEGEPHNLTKSVSDRYVFNTAITRSQYLVVAVGNPFLLLHIEKCMKSIYGKRAVDCWSRFMRQCLDCNTFHFANEKKREFERENFISLREALFPTTSTEIITDIDTDNKESDSILNAYKRELEKIPECRSTKLTLQRVHESDLAWIMSETSTDQNVLTSQNDDEDEVQYEDKYECVLECQTYRKAEAIPINKEKRVVIIRGSGNRIPAFNGDTVLVGVFPNNPENKCYGRVLKVKIREHEPRFLCRVSHRNPVIFYPVDETNPVFCNLPRISRDLLWRRDKDAVKVELESRKDVVVFSSNINIREGKIPPIQQIIPLSVAKDMIFVVAFIQWKKGYRTPLGCVVNVMPKGFTAFSAERLLKMKHGIIYDVDCANENSVDAECGPNSGTLYDRVFTIDPDGAQNLDDAVSLVKLHADSELTNVETYQLGVHIVNCAKHIEQDEDIDKEARRKGTSVYGGREGKIMQMLPAQTREKLSLKPNRIRDVLSVVGEVVISSNEITVSESKIKIEQAQIKSSVQLTYMRAQQIMDGSKVPELSSEINHFDCTLNQPSLSKTLQLLYNIALHLRKNRLQSDAAYAYDLNDPEDSDCWQAHMLIEELMIWANSTVAARVHTAYPHAALLRRQLEPNQEKLSDFIDGHKSVTKMSLALSCLTSGIPQDGTGEQVSFVLAATTLNQIREAISTKNVVRLASLIASDRYHPQIAAVLSKLRSHFPKAEYCCTDEEEEDSCYRHYSLKLDNYTHFSSPLRRYLDIEVQRMLIQLPEVSKIDGLPKEFDHSNHEKLCTQLNNRARNANQFQRSLNNVDLAIAFSSSSEAYEVYIADNVKGSIEVWFPQLKLKDIRNKEKKIPLKCLGPFANVKEEELLMRESQTLHWKIQMTSFSTDQGKFIFKLPGLSIHNKDEKLTDDIINIDMLTADDANPQNFTLSTIKHKASRGTPATTAIPLKDWKKALNFVKDPNITNLKELETVLPKPSADKQSQIPNFEVNMKPSSPYIDIYHQASFKPHDVVQVWMTRSMREALITPTIQLIEVSPLVRICVQHNTHPAECFSDFNLSYASRKFYSDINEYVQLWEKVVLAEAAEVSVRDSKQVIIHDVTLKWPHLTIPSNCIDEEYYQPTDSITLTLPEKYVENCSEFVKFNEGDLICARYGTDPHAEARAVFHMVIHKIQYTEEDDETKPSKVWMKFIGENNCRISEKMKAILDNKCELQLISLSTTSQRVYKGLLKLLDANNVKKEQGSTSEAKKPRKTREISKLVTYIALGNEIKGRVPDDNKKATKKVFKENLQARQMWTAPNIFLNRVQEEASNLAFTNPFQLIQGPPGTGKSETGAHIAYTFAMANRHLSPRKCVLYCGPSNKSVDVVLEKLHKLCESNRTLNLKILRIYNRAVEIKDFPGPDNKGRNESDYKLPDCAPNYALHHKIRLKPSKLTELEKKFGALPVGSILDGKTYREYRLAQVKAEDVVLTEHFDIILCTCSETSSARVIRCVFPRQCIVDECGMANEPECIIPLELCEHVVLIGDHKQLQPVITYKSAAEHGLSTSLFQRYAENFEGQGVKRLTIQYRMHEAICEFPSKYFYDGQLETADSIKKRSNPETKLNRFWRGPQKSACPILFCDVIGKEDDHKTGSKATGGKKIGIDSKFNETEATIVVKIAMKLYKVHRVDVGQIAVLTPYSAQKNLIDKKMKEAKLKIKVASITESQGDEYGIVILSTVRSLPEKEIKNPEHVQADRGWLYETLGFLTDPHQLNVGITRSKYGLIIVGNKLMLSYDKHWKALIDHYDTKGCIVDGEEFCSDP